MIPQDVLDHNQGMTDWCILMGYRGSIAHGTYRPKEHPTSIDDKDVMAVCIPPQEYYFGLHDYGSRGTVEVKHGEWDVVIYEIRKMMGLLEGGNPNVLNLLWLQPQHYLKRTSVGQRLINNRHLFVGKHVYHSFVGYAHGQLHKTEHFSFKGYMGEKRKQLVEKFGYDTKNASHLIRILRMGIEFLIEGDLHVMRQDGPQLLEIKDGQWTLEQVKAESAKLFKQAEEAYLRSTLPTRPDRAKVHQLCVELVQEHFYHG